MQFQLTTLCLCLLLLQNVQCIPQLKSSVPPQVQIDTVKGLIGRVFGQDKVQYFTLQIVPPTPDGLDTFTISGTSNAITISGSTGVSLASGLNWYLKYFCNCQVSWGRNGSGNQLNIPSTLPGIPTPITQKSLGKYSYYMNICTLSYSSAFWDWSRWEQELDWMALNGINLPLSLTGQEYIWEIAFKQLGFTQDEINSFFAGPAFLAWNRMGNLKKWGGPLPSTWTLDQSKLQLQILQRGRNFGMLPVLSAFSGHVPDGIKRLFPNANVTASANWAGFVPPYSGVLLLEPLDPLFQTIGKLFIDIQTSIYGSDHIYSADTYNEMEPASKDPGYLKLSSAAVYQAMKSSDPASVWLMQGWLFLDDGFWGQAQVQGYLAGVPDNSMIILDLDSLRAPQWSRLNNFYGKSWIWCLLHNFGGNRRVYGDLPGISTVPFQAKQASANMIGIGMTPEAIEQNPVVYELMSEVMWHAESFAVSDWVNQYALRRYNPAPGQQSDLVTSAWKTFLSGVYGVPPDDESAHNILELFPTVARHMGMQVDYNASQFLSGVKNLVSAGFAKTEGPSAIATTGPYLYDVTDFVRQILGNFFYDLYGQFFFAYQNFLKDKSTPASAAQTIGDNLISTLRDLDNLLGSNENYMLGLWIADALKLAENYTNDEKTLMNFNARNQVTLWGPNGQINDYAAKHWSGLVGNYYLGRWTILVQTVVSAINSGTPVDWNAYQQTLLKYGQYWNNNTSQNFPVVPSGDTLQIAAAIIQKYSTSTNTYEVFPNSDSPGNDIQQAWTNDIGTLKVLCDLNPMCTGFISSGWMKYAVNSPLSPADRKSVV